MGGGKGPGSYYPWIFLQIAILLPIARPCLQKGTILQKTLIALILCEGLEMMSSFINIPDFVYRLLAVRYVFLIFLGWLWVERGIVLNWKTVSISLLSLLSIVYFEYFYQPCEPWFFDTAWKCHRWPCFYYVSTLLCGLLYYLYYKIKRINLIVSITKLLARCSYEIFLVQMLVIPILSQVVFVENKIGQYVIMTVLVFISSFIGGYYFNRIYNKVVLKLIVNK